MKYARCFTLVFEMIVPTNEQTNKEQMIVWSCKGKFAHSTIIGYQLLLASAKWCLHNQVRRGGDCGGGFVLSGAVADWLELWRSKQTRY